MSDAIYCPLCGEFDRHKRTCPEYKETASDRIASLEAQLAATRRILAGTDYPSLPNDWTLPQAADARMDDIQKYMDQVRHTCARAEKAEAQLAERTALLIRKEDEWATKYADEVARLSAQLTATRADALEAAAQIADLALSKHPFDGIDIGHAIRLLTDLPVGSEASAWRPIETAPKDGTEVLVLSKNGRRVAKYDDRQSFFGPGWYIPMDSSQYAGGTYAAGPTHWQPLPPPPATEAASGPQDAT